MKKPSVERGPKPSNAIAQPQTMITSGVRQPERDEARRRSPAVADICIPHFLFADSHDRPRCLLRGVNASAWKSQPRPLRKRRSQRSIANRDYRPVELIFAPSGGGMGPVLYSDLLVMRISQSPQDTPTSLRCCGVGSA